MNENICHKICDGGIQMDFSKLLNKLRILLKVLVLSLMVLGFNACFPKITKEPEEKPEPVTSYSEDVPDVSNWRTYSVPPFEISLPPDWQGIDTAQPLFSLGTSLPDGTIFFAQEARNDEQKPVTLLFLQEDVPLINSLDKYLSLSIHNLQNSAGVIGGANHRTVNLNIGQVEILNFYSKNYDERGLAVEGEITQYIFLNKGKGYVLSFSSERESATQHKSTFMAIANSLTFVN